MNRLFPNYSCRLLPKEDGSGYAITDGLCTRYYGAVDWVLPDCFDNGFRFKMLEEAIKTGNIFFEKYGFPPGVVSASSNGSLQEGGSGKVLTRALEEEKDLEELVCPVKWETTRVRLLKNRLGTIKIAGLNFLLFGDINERRPVSQLFGAVRNYARINGAPNLGIYTCVPEIGLECIEIDGNWTVY